MDSPATFAATVVERARRLGEGFDAGGLARSMTERMRGWRKQLDQVILTRLPQFADVVEDQPASPAEAPSPPTDGPLDDKRKAAEKVVGTFANLAAANAFNPVPGLDVTIDLGILTAMTRSLTDVYGLTAAQAAALEKQARTRTFGYPAVQQVLERLAPRLAERALALTLPRIGLELLARETTKWLPVAGSMLAAGIGYRMVHRLGKELSAECESAVKEV